MIGIGFTQQNCNDYFEFYYFCMCVYKIVLIFKSDNNQTWELILVD